MSRAIYIGDEAHAAAWRLAGVHTCAVPGPLQAGQALAQARQDADLVLLAQSCEAAAGATDQRGPAPLLLVLPDAPTLAQPAELAQRVRRLLGMAP